MLKLRFRLFGSFEIGGADLRPMSFDGRKPQELISYLVLAPGQTRSREATIEALWPELARDRGRKRIRQALWHVHQTADHGESTERRLILAAAEHLAINRERWDGCDVLEFSAAVEALGANLTGSDTDDLEDALDLYRGPLLEGCFSEWCLVERERLEDLYLVALDAASARAEATRNYHASARWARVLLRRDRAHERSHRRLMRLYAIMNDRSRALRQFERCCASLERELGVRPSAQTIALATAIREDALQAIGEAVVPAPSVGEPPHLDVALELSALRRSIDDLRAAVHGRLS